MKAFATVGWTANDIQDLAPKMSDAEATAWLEKNEQRLKERLCELGWEAIQIMLTYDGMDTSEAEDADAAIAWTRKLAPGDEVTWNDPDEGKCTRTGEISTIEFFDEACARITMKDGWHGEVLLCELS
jgi:hypothetical protein